MKSDPTNRSLRPFRPDARRSDRKTPIRTERLSAGFPAGGADACESESRPTSGTIPIRRTGSADLFRTACALLFLLPLLSGCDDIFEQDIDRARIEVVAPKHDAHIEAGEVTFLWRPLSGARSYRLTVVSPSFARASRVWADTTLRADSLHAADRFSLTLDEGNYQWSLQAFNGVYRSEESVYSLRIPLRRTSRNRLSAGKKAETMREIRRLRPMSRKETTRPTMIITRHRTIRTNPPTVILPSHEIATADIPVTRRSARYLGRRGVEALFLRAETCGFRSGCRARCPEQSPCGHRYAATRLSRSVPACGCDETFRPGVRFGKSARTVESEERTSFRQARLYGPYP